MTTPSPLGIYEFDQFRLDAVERSLWKGNKRLTVGGRAFDVLTTLVRRAGKLVTKEELFRTAWQGRVVEESNIHVQISSLRKLLGSEAISTISGHGYRLEMLLKEGALNEPQPLGATLPQPFGSLVSRPTELAEIIGRANKSRLVTVRGMGGIGKSHLAIEACRTLMAGRSNLRCWYVPISGSESGESLIAALLAPVGKGLPSADNQLQAFFLAVRQAPTLLLIDSCEMVTDILGPILRRALEQCPELVVVCTSRKALGLVGESVYEVPPLEASAAKQLFLDRASALTNAIDLSSPGDLRLEKILSRLDGIPLAIELAAARLRVVGLPELESQLADLLDSLVGVDTSLPDRQRTLRATIEWSYQLLTTDEVDFLNRIAVFENPFSVRASAAVGLGDEDATSRAVTLLSGLVDKSLLSPASVGGKRLYRVMQSVREYGVESLRKSGGYRPAKDSHAQFLRRKLDAAIKEQHQTEWFANHLPEISSQWSDYQAALSFCLLAQASDGNLGAELASSLIHYWIDQGKVTDAVHWLEIGLGRVDNMQVRLSTLRALGCAHTEAGRFDKAIATLSEALEGFSSIDPTSRDVAITANELGIAYFGMQDFSEALSLYELSRKLHAAAQRDERVGQATQNIAVVHFVEGHLLAAEASIEEALVLHRRARNVRSQFTSLLWLAELKYINEQYELSYQLLRQAEQLRPTKAADLPAAATLFRVARCAAMLGKLEEAGRAASESILILLEIGNSRALAECLDSVVVVGMALGESARASRLLQVVSSWRERRKTPRSRIWSDYFAQLAERMSVDQWVGEEDLGDGVAELPAAALTLAQEVLRRAATHSAV